MREHRSGLHPTLGPQQRRIRHITGILARNLTFQIRPNGKHVDTYGSMNSKDASPPKFAIGDDDKTGSQAHSLNSSSFNTPSSSRSSSSGQLKAPNFTIDDADTFKEDRLSIVRDRSATSSPSPLPKSHTASLSSPLSSRVEEPRLPNRAGTPVSVGAINNLHHLEPLKRVHSGSSIMSLGSTTVEDSSMLRSVYRNSRHASVSDVERGLLDSYFTLHMSMNDPPFYTSEIVANSINPTFRTFDTLGLSDMCDNRKNEAVIRLWSRNSVPESASIARDSDTLRHQHDQLTARRELKQPKDADNFRLMLEWEVTLDSLTYLCCNLTNLPNFFPQNSIIIELTDGYYSLPDVVSEVLGSESDDRTAVEKLLAIKPKPSYTYNHILKLNTLYECILDTQRSSADVRNNIESVLLAEKDRFYMARKKGEKETIVNSRRRIIDNVKQEQNQVKSKIESIRRQIQEREQALGNARESLNTGREYLEEGERNLERNKDMHKKTVAGLTTRRKELIADMFSIYPIDQDYNDPQLYHIRGMPLPNSVYTGYDDEIVATALGYTSHLVNMLAYYLAIPLRYPITPMGSRASVRDPISILQGSRSFPLYAKGVDRYRFEYGVFLLNKNIEQLVNAHGLIVMDLRHTLPNIHYLIQAVLTTSVSTTPSSISVLSISSYARHRRANMNPNTLQPGSLKQEI
ncbi:hypothetical protein K450DRAFT_261018 [Umbelopsis ramanniana AG]|uniref:UV radiation resistance-associated gene protein n=1 Tax=Umbelopsis ramanniana AG TaxID=1314678 RepID=A0AAD5E336_UMBRA|nr:uncharacterized protein K450DRAFT_261018 [Umbelopsis ramanniana AG]KAI8575576.1 hypothetical protein K450DRAFT_261018 [Umbelopsis ramanniana AG]